MAHWLNHYFDYSDPGQDDDYYCYDDDDFDDHYPVVTAFRPRFEIVQMVVEKKEQLKLQQQLLESDAEKKARWLQEQAKIKEKAEKKRLKKQKQKERKRREKMEKAKENGEAVGLEESKTEDRVVEGGAEGGKEVVAEVVSSGQSDASDGECNDVDELDFDSCFVSKAAQVVQRKLEKGQKKLANKEKRHKESKDNVPKEQLVKGDPPSGTLVSSATEQRVPLSTSTVTKHSEVPAGGPQLNDNIERSNELAAQGLEYAKAGCYQLAVDCFTQAIQFNPTEFKLFGNRSLCLDKLNEYEKALADAELSLGMCPGWSKGLYRKGRALAGLKRYDEAVEAFQEVLKQDSGYVEAAKEKLLIQSIQLSGYGFTQEQCLNALIVHGTVEKALMVLSRLNPHVVPHDPVPTRPPTVAHHACNIARQAEELELFPVWVGNLNPDVSERMLFSLFSKVGPLHSIRILRKRHCAFVNYTQKECCDRAIRYYHNFQFMDDYLIVRYPDRIPEGGRFSKAALKSQRPSRWDSRGGHMLP
ncbi:tetratricopeptide repeat protein 31-like [Corythoichthys intestinalis]|uniref:tetratricopeptide repeat protein 31-like n=1 Tax=Corythoichthys intestinalis TaxID=161448 RepID=UPI0025A5EB6E|nr:tetratricopeptide repeat protein 31-like [Corythoichthys intestinalis]